MSYNYRIIFLSLSILSSSLAIENSVTIKPLDEADASEIINHLINNKQQEAAQTISQQPAFDDLEIKEMEFVFIRSPKEAQCIVNHLQDPPYFPTNEEYRSVIFVGEPGTGKTVMAKAIAYKMIEHNWEYRFLPSTSFLGEHRNTTAMLLQRELEAIKKSKKPTILIIDELNLLMENSESKNHDTDATAKALWTFIDQQKNNPNFFFIGTMNRINKLPQAFKSRVILNNIKFPLVSALKLKTELIRINLTTEYTELDKDVTHEFLDEELSKIGDCSERDLKNISRAICRTSKINAPSGPSPMVIKKAAIVAVIDQYLRNTKELDYDLKEETDEERQNRYHRENMEMQEKHFVQQQIIQISAGSSDHVRAVKDTNNKEGLWYTSLSMSGKQYYSLISDEQATLYNDMMKETREREAALAEAAAAEKKAQKWFWQKKQNNE